MRYPVILLIFCQLILAAACQNGGLTSGGKQTDIAAPSAVSQDGVSLQITGVEKGDEFVRLKFTAVNGKDNAVRLAGNNDPLILRDNSGREYQSKEEKIELQPLTANDLSVEFLGGLASDAKTLSLTANTKYSNENNQPRIVVENIPAPNGSAVEFKLTENPPAAALEGKTFNHPNGTSFTVSKISVGENTIDLEFQAVNGSKNADKFSTRNNQTFLQDEKTNRYYLIPANTGNQIELPAQQKLSGTLRFAGKIPLDVNKLNLHINDGYGGDNEYAASPKIIINDISVR